MPTPTSMAACVPSPWRDPGSGAALPAEPPEHRSAAGRTIDNSTSSVKASRIARPLPGSGTPLSPDEGQREQNLLGQGKLDQSNKRPDAVWTGRPPAVWGRRGPPPTLSLGRAGATESRQASGLRAKIMAAVAAVLIAVVVAPGVAEAKRLSLTDAKWAITKVARADYLAQQRADAGQELIFKLQAYGVRECDRRSRRYVVCAYSIIRTDDELTQGSECVTIVGAFRPKHSRRVRTEILRDARCFDW